MYDGPACPETRKGLVTIEPSDGRRMDTFSVVSGIRGGLAVVVASGKGFSITIAGVVVVKGSGVPITLVGLDGMVVSVGDAVAVGVGFG